MRARLIRGLFLFLVSAQSAFAWGGAGHRIVARIAEAGLSPTAASTVATLLNHQTLADVAALPDTWRRTTEPQSTNWHFVNIPKSDTAYDESRDCPPQNSEVGRDCAVAAIEHFKTVLADTTQSNEVRGRALTFLVHFIGDIHQPLHAVDNHDQGGNKVPVSWFGAATHTIISNGEPKEVPWNLHAIWDEAIIARTGLDEAAYASQLLAAPPPLDATAGTTVDWVNGSYELAKSAAYAIPDETPSPLGDAYFAANRLVVDRQLLLAGLRLRAVLEAAIGTAASAVAHLPAPTHIVIVIEENKSFADVMSSGNAPYLESLASGGALLTQFFASHHPSQPNYIDFFAGQTLGVCDDSCPTTTFDAVNLGSALFAAGKTFAGFAENLPASKAKQRCSKTLYASKHCPWVNFSNLPPGVSRPFHDFPQDPAGFDALPTVSLVIPNLSHDMHNGSNIPTEVQTGDSWLKSNLAAYATWAATHDSLLIVTWDEDSASYHIHCPTVITTTPPQNQIPTIITGAPVTPGTTSNIAYSHYDLLRTILDMYGIAPFGGAVGGKDIEGIWK